MVGNDGNADAGTHVQVRHFESERVLELGRQPLRNDGGPSCALPGQYDAELVAAEADQGVRRSESVAQPRPEHREDAVAHLVAERVVDLLEVVEIDQQQGEVARLPADEEVVEHVRQVPAVPQARQLVRHGLSFPGLGQPSKGPEVQQ